MVFQLAYRMCGTRNDAEDVAQECMLRVSRGLVNFRGDSKLKTWIYGIALNAVSDWRKRQAKNRILKEEYAANYEPAEEPDTRSQQLNRVLETLSEKERRAIVFSIYEEMTHGEIAKILGCAETTISWRIFRAKAKLKAFFAAEEQPESEQSQGATTRPRSVKS